MLYNNELYSENIKMTANYDLPWDKLKNKTILIAGISGLIGSYMTDIIMYRNEIYSDNIKIIGIARNQVRTEKRFKKYIGDNNFKLIIQDITDKMFIEDSVDFIINCASNTHPLDYSAKPISTITTNIIGTNNLLEFASNKGTERYLYVSSVEIYGENKGDTEYFAEDYCGYINSNTLRAGYPEAKRCGEALCQAYIKEKGIDCVIVRLPRVYGETMLTEDSKALSQFIKKGLAKEDIVLKSEGKQLFSYIYVPDAVTAMLIILLSGECGEAYNVADENSDITLGSLAELIADKSGTSVIFDLPDTNELQGYSTATKAILDSEKMHTLNWKPMFNINNGIETLLKILSESEH